MCEPTTIIAIATAAASYYAQKKAADKTEQAYKDQQAVVQKQTDEAAAQQKGDIAREAIKERSRITALAADAGVTGNSVDAMLRATDTAAGMNSAITEKNRANANQTAIAQTQSQIAGINRPSAVASGLQIAGAAYNGYDKTYGKPKR